MRTSVNRFLFLELIFTVLIAVIGFALLKLIFPERFSPDIFVLQGIIAVMTAVMYSMLYKVAEKDLAKFSSRFVLINGSKMMIYLVFIMIYAFTFREKAVTFLVSFLILYYISLILFVSQMGMESFSFCL